MSWPPSSTSLHAEPSQPCDLIAFSKAISGCSQSVRDYIAGALSENTRRAYYADLAHFQSWGGLIPSRPENIAEYLAAHAQVNSIATLERRLATIAKAHRVIGAESPTRSELVRATLRGIKRKHGRPQRRVKPLTRDLLFEVLEALGTDLKATRDKALLLIGFAGAFRRSELCQLAFSDVEWAKEGIFIHIKRSKTDQEGIGRRIAIPIGMTKWCPVAALQNWLYRARIVQGPLFRAVNSHRTLSEDALSADAVSVIVKERIAALGLNPQEFSGHSLRAGFATSASLANISSWKIREQTGHRNDQMLQRYIRFSATFSDNPNSTLL